MVGGCFDKAIGAGGIRRIEEYRRELLVAAMRAHDGRQAAAARWLGISRQTLSYLLRRFDLEGPW